MPRWLITKNEFFCSATRTETGKQSHIPFAFLSLVHKQGLGTKEKTSKLTLLRFSDNTLSNYLILKSFLHALLSRGLFTNIIKGCGTRFWCTYYGYFFHNTLSIYQFQYQTSFPSQDIEKCFLSPCLANWWCHKF